MSGRDTITRARRLLSFGVLLSLLAACQGDGSVPRTTPGPTWRGIVPGMSTETDVIRILGEPPRQEKTGEYTIYMYPSSGSLRAVALRHGKVELIRDELTWERYLDRVLERYGEPEKITWSPSIFQHTRLFVFARHGIAVIAQNQVPPSRSIVFGTWYFEPMELSQFEQTLAPLFAPTGLPDPRHDIHPEGYWIQEP